MTPPDRHPTSHSPDTPSVTLIDMGSYALRKGSRVGLVLVAGALLVAALVVGSPSSSSSQAAAPTVQQLDRVTLGRSMSCGGVVSEAQWRALVALVVTPRFPRGLTVWLADGQWRSENGHIEREPTFVRELLHAPDVRSDTAVVEIIDAYKRAFCQQSVLWVRDRVDVRL